MHFILKNILNLILPSRCFACANFSEEPVCFGCQNKIIFINSFNKNIFLIAKYEGVIKKAIKNLKFNRKRVIANSLGRILASNMPNIGVDIIVPVPLSRERFSERGFNQSELIAQEYSDKFSKPLINDALIRTRETLPQFGLKRNDRLLNVQGAFKIKNNTVIKNKKVLLVDDILTTGFTAAECCRTLKEGGARAVFIAALSKA